MEDKATNMNEPCIIPGIEHNIEFKVAAFGQQTFQCTLCGIYFDVIEDSQPQYGIDYCLYVLRSESVCVDFGDLLYRSYGSFINNSAIAKRDATAPLLD